MSPKTKPILIGGLLVVGLTFVGVTPAGATSADTVETSIDHIVADMDDIGVAAEDYDSEALADACQNLALDAGAALEHDRPKIIPKRSWRHLRNAWRYAQQAGEACHDGALNMDPAQLRRSTELFDSASFETDLASQNF